MLKEIFDALEPPFEAEGAKPMYLKSGKFLVPLQADCVKGVASVRHSEDRVRFQTSFEAHDGKGMYQPFVLDAFPYAKEAYAYLLMRNAFDDQALWMMDYINGTVHMGSVLPLDQVIPAVEEDAKSAVRRVVQSAALAAKALHYAQTGEFPSDQIALLRDIYKGSFTL